MLQLHWTQRSACVPQALHLSSYPDSTGPARVMALQGAPPDYCDRSRTLNPPSGVTTRHSYTTTTCCTHKHTLTHSLAHALTFERDPSQWLFVFSEKNKKTGCREKHQSQSAGCFYWSASHILCICYLNCYLMVSHADVRAYCVINNTPLVIFFLKSGMKVHII